MSTDNFALPDENATQAAPVVIEENFPLVDPHQVENQLIDQFKEMQENMPAEDVAAHFFQMYYPIYNQLLSGLSNKDARRVAQHVVQWPLEDENPKFNDKKAEQAFQVGIRLIDCKMIMRTFVEMERQKELTEQKAQEEAAKAENTATTEAPAVEAETQGETNG